MTQRSPYGYDSLRRRHTRRRGYARRIVRLAVARVALAALALAAGATALRCRAPFELRNPTPHVTTTPTPQSAAEPDRP